MSPSAGLGLALALASTAALNWGFFAQHGAAVALPPLRLRRPLASLRALAASGRWRVGFLVGIAGWALYAAALRFAPLSLVQAVSAGGLGLLVLLVWLTPGGRAPSRREAWVVAVATTGLVLLAVSLAGRSGSGTIPAAFQVGAWLVALAATAGAAASSVRLGFPAAGALATAAGILYATGDVATKAAVASAALVFVPAVLVAHGLAFMSLQLAFQRGSALVTAGLATLLTNALPIAAGALLYGERIPAGARGDLRLLAFALVTVGAALLAAP